MRKREERKMSIKARINKDLSAICQNCGCSKKESVEIFDLRLPIGILTICDKCMQEELFDKCLGCVCYTDHKVKTPSDIRVINSRYALKNKRRKKSDKI